MSIFLQINQRPKNAIKKKRKDQIPIKLKKTIKSTHEPTPKSKSKNLSLSNLAFNPKSFKFEDLKFQEKNNLNFYKQNVFFKHIKKKLNYPSELIENEIYGVVTAEVFVDKNLQYLESKTKIKGGSKYLKVHVARILRQAFESLNPNELTIKKMIRLNLLFDFRLTTAKNKLERSKITDQYFFSISKHMER